jgi:hypothetical protein
MAGDATAYYLWPAVWVAETRPPPGAPVHVRTLAEQADRTRPPSGIAVKVLREGMFIFDFAGCPPCGV